MQKSHNERIPEVTGALLAGGKSRRMGQDKACAEVAGQPLYARPLQFLQRHFQTVVIAGDRPDLASPEIPAVADLYPGSALGGLFTALKTAETPWIFVLPCDLPFPDAGILKLLLDRREGADAVVPRTPRGDEPLFALYHKNCLPTMEGMLKARQFAVHQLFRRIRCRRLAWPELPTGWQRSLLNVNTPGQLRQIREQSV
ncbi:MAG TPA: molybdenum cofactor guanylyltransferase [Desulfuromonadales bacterium]|nr:molybdenum cofactor guanylyltransferase [Desulfuromonadales bacterium]